MDYLERAIQTLRDSDIVAAPTETVYGLFGDATSDEAIQKIYRVKGRPSNNPLIIHVSSIAMASEYCVLPDEDKELIERFWSQLKLPITFVVLLKENSEISNLVTAGLKTVAIRCPNNEIALSMIKGVRKPLAAPSANTSMTVSPTSYEMVMNDIGSKISLVIDGGEASVGVESTILDITKKPYVVLRHGGTPIEVIKKNCDSQIAENANETCLLAPGMQKKHYAPSIPLRMNAEAPEAGEAFIAFGDTKFDFEENLSPRADLEEAAHNLFSYIKRCDNQNKFKGIAVMPIPKCRIGKAINDRLKRASYINKKKVLLLILDGFGYSESKTGNATLEAKYIWGLMDRYPSCLLNASEHFVGLPDGQFGNSEVGHLTIGSGRIIKQKLPMISDSITNGEFDNNPELIRILQNIKVCHIMGLFSSGGVHSHISHFFHCLSILRLHNIPIKAHLFLDGRDVAPRDAFDTLRDALDKKLINLEEIATIHGRYYAMDRDNRTDRTEVSYQAIKEGVSECANVTDPVKMIEQFYKEGILDEVMPPFIMRGYKGIAQEETVWMTNYRTDRIKQILHLIHNDGIKIINMVNVDTEIDKNAIILFKPKKVTNTLGEIISKHDLKQLRISETEKYAHVTYFMNGGEDVQYEGEDRCLVDSPKVKDYSETPDMSAAIMTDKLMAFIKSSEYDLIVANYATPDMIGHTGNLEKTRVAIEKLDDHVKNVIDCAIKEEYQIVVTADHGNAEHMLEADGSVCKTHTCSKVPFICISNDLLSDKAKEEGSLKDLAPTILHLLGIEKPIEMKESGALVR